MMRRARPDQARYPVAAMVTQIGAGGQPAHAVARQDHAGCAGGRQHFLDAPDDAFRITIDVRQRWPL
jgi:hypothetical protein